MIDDLQREEDASPTETTSVVSARLVIGFVISQLLAIQHRCEQHISSGHCVTIFVCKYHSHISELVENKKYTVLTGRLW